MNDNETPEQPADPQQTPQPEPENMEVHYEPHFKHHHHKKHLAEYAKEFLMIFFAVFLGFLAENLREHIAENGKEKEYVRGFINDLKQDSVALNFQLQSMQPDVNGMDSLLALSANNIGSELTRRKIYQLTYGHLTLATSFFPHSTTLQQVKSSGELRLISKKGIVDSILNYYSFIQDAEVLEQELSTASYMDVLQSRQKLFDFQILEDPKKLNNYQISIPPFTDKSELRIYYNKVEHFKGVTSRFRNLLLDIQQSDLKLIGLLKKTYHLKDE